MGDDKHPPPEPSAPRGPGLGVALAVYFAALAGVISLVALEVESVRTTLLYDVVMLATGIALLIGFWPSMGPLLGWPRPIGWRRWGLALLVLGALFLTIEAISALVPDLFRDILAPYRREDLSTTFAILQIGPLTATAEELLFRGVILGGLASAFPPRTATILSAAMFATLHLSPLNFVHTFAMGMVYAELVLATRSLWPAIGLHALWNSAIVMMQL